jgi:hypothetical protein
MDTRVAAWLPESKGGEKANLRFGHYEYHGWLPMTFFSKVQNPLFTLSFGFRINEISSKV